MSNRGKKIFLALSITLPFLLYSVYYYSGMIKNAPYRFTDFQSVTLKYGIGDSLVNQFDSKSGNYQYLNNRDSLVKVKVKLNKDDLLILHHKAVELGFWDFPEKMMSSDSTKSPRYYLEYKYKQKTKKMLFEAQYNNNTKLRDAAKQLVDFVTKTVNDAENRQK